MVLIVNGSEPAKHRLQPHTRARHTALAPGEHARVTRYKSRESGIRGRNDVLLLHLAAAPSVLAVYATAAACGIALMQLCDAGPSAGLIQCERTLCVAAGRWQCTAAHRLWRLECAPGRAAVLLVINLRIRAAADCCCGSSSSLLLPDSVKPAAQRGVQNSRGFVPPEAERIRARRPELDGTTRLTETRGTGHGRATEREVASGASDKTTRKTRI